MFRRWIAAVVVLALSGGAWADDKPPADDYDSANDALHGNDKDKAKPDEPNYDEGSEAARGGEAEPEIDPIQALNDIADKMKDAEAALHKAGSFKYVKDAIERQRKAKEELEKLIKDSKEAQGKSAEEIQKMIEEALAKQQQAMDDAAKLMGGAGSQQTKALEEIEKLIKQAKESG